MDNHISTLVAQFPVTLDIQHNLNTILSVIAAAKPHTLAIFPEGALSGYTQDKDFPSKIDRQHLATAMGTLREFATQSDIHLIFGTCLPENGQWYNAGIYYGPQHEQFIYRKVNLATSERSLFTAGSDLSPLKLKIDGRSLKLGIQLCREIRFPEQWQYLARQGTEIFIYLTNAVGDATQAPVWRSHLISRAAENQRFVLCANNAHAAQKCPSAIVTPTGSVAWETCSSERQAKHYMLDLSAVSDWYLSQSRLNLFVPTSKLA